MKKRTKSNDRRGERGTLLIEMLAAFAIISVTLVMVTNAFLGSNRASGNAQRLVEVADAVAFALADITREARVSDTYSTNVDADRFEMVRIAELNDQTADSVVYSIGACPDFSGSSCLLKSVLGVSLPITPPNISVTDLAVEIIPETTGGTRAIVTLSAKHVDDTTSSEPVVYIQTTFTER